MGIVGIQLGNLSFFVCIAFGSVTLLLASANALTILQVAGASYLVLLGVRAGWSSFRRSAETLGPPSRSTPSYGDLIVQAAAVQVTNPKGTFVYV
jgi:threonine/homoserine/homoserine lactone efflux protein